MITLMPNAYRLLFSCLPEQDVLGRPAFHLRWVRYTVAYPQLCVQSSADVDICLGDSWHDFFMDNDELGA